MTPEIHNQFDIYLRSILGVIAIIALIVGWNQYTELKEQEYKKDFYKEQIHVISELFRIMTDADLATTTAQKMKAGKEFEMIYKGAGRTFLTPKLFSTLKLPLKYIATCVTYKRIYEDINCNHSSAMMMSNFAKVARTTLSESWQLDFKEIRDTDPWVDYPFETK